MLMLSACWLLAIVFVSSPHTQRRSLSKTPLPSISECLRRGRCPAVETLVHAILLRARAAALAAALLCRYRGSFGFDIDVPRRWLCRFCRRDHATYDGREQHCSLGGNDTMSRCSAALRRVECAVSAWEEGRRAAACIVLSVGQRSVS